MTEQSAPTSPPEPSMFDLPEWTGVVADGDNTAVPRVKFAGVRFEPVGKVYHYTASGFDDLKVGDWVIVDTARGRQMGQVATLKPPKDPGVGHKRIERRATGRDMAMRHYYEGRELEAMIACRAESAALRLPVKIVRAEYSFDGQTLTLLYSSDQEERVEVGALREAMSRLYRARIEMRQISPREVAKILGGMGACGIEERCCSRFLTEFSPISIKHAKEQNLSLNPHDITGMCGRLRCCLVYEYEQYVEARRHLPKLKSMIGTPLGPGKVVEILHLRDSVRVRVGEGPEARDTEFHREQLMPLEELKRLQDKAMSGTCDRHEGGGCDCGRGGSEPASPAGEGAGIPPAAQAYIKSNERRQAEERRKGGQNKRREERRPTAGDYHRPPGSKTQSPREGDMAPPPEGQAPGEAGAADAEGDAAQQERRPQRRPLLKRKP